MLSHNHFLADEISSLRHQNLIEPSSHEDPKCTQDFPSLTFYNAKKICARSKMDISIFLLYICGAFQMKCECKVGHS